MQKAVVLLSSGLDSTVNLYQAKENYDVALALHFDYGQKAALRERECAQKTAAYLKVPFQVIELPWFQHFSTNSLTSNSVKLVKDVDIHSHAASTESAKNVWVPNRNGIFLNIAAGFAEQNKADFVIPGFNIEEAATFPDNSTEFMSALDKSFSFSTSNHVKVKCFTDTQNKKEIYALGKKLGVKYEWVWPCYEAGAKPCGHCESCLRFENAQKGSI